MYTRNLMILHWHANFLSNFWHIFNNSYKCSFSWKFLGHPQSFCLFSILKCISHCNFCFLQMSTVFPIIVLHRNKGTNRFSLAFIQTCSSFLGFFVQDISQAKEKNPFLLIHASHIPSHHISYSVSL